ncbi:MAG: NAD(P)-dependent oxidoreductase [Vicinamibacterales bacterium]
MNILVLGATGGVGRQVVSQALAESHNVTALVRDTRRITTVSDRLQVVQGDVTADSPTLSDVVRGQDAVICALGVPSLTPHRLIERSAPLIVRAMERHGVRRLIHTSAFGVGGTYADVPLLPRLFIRTLLRRVYGDKAKGEESIHGSDLDWTIVYPAGLTDGPRTGRCRAGEHIALRGLPTISRADVAEFLLKQIADRTYVRKDILIAS